MNPGASGTRAELLAPGTRIGRYHLLRRLAIGGMAELHLACAEGLAGFQKVVVLKRVLPHLAADSDFIQMFINEARLAANLDHPNLVQVMDIGEAEGDYFYVMEYVHGRNVRELLAAAGSRGGLPLAVALAVVIAAAAGLHHAHDRTDLSGEPLGLVHRDVSPSNVLVSYDGGIKVTDFGIAKASARTAETIGGAMKGKIGYMSPEQCRGDAVDRRSDVFALGILLFELSTNERLFYADNDFAVLNQIVQGRFEPPSARVPDYPPALERIVLRALANDPATRYPTAAALLHELEAFAHEERLRCTSAVVAEWMHEAFGQPPFPRVEVRPLSDDDPLETIPTLVPLGGEGGADPLALTRAEPTASTDVAVLPLGQTLVSEPPPRASRGLAMAAAALAVVGAGAIGWSMLGEPPADETPPESPAATLAAPSAASTPVIEVAEPTPPTTPIEATPTEATPTEATGGTDTGGEGSTSTGEIQAPEPASGKRTKRSRRQKSRTPRSRDEPKGDPNVLYPVKAGQ